MSLSMTYKGPICDTVGFRQHGANCATDTILQVLMFADGFKPTTQPTLYTIKHSEIVSRTRAVFPPEEHAFMIRYFKLIQERFQNHYDALQCELEFTEGCEKLNKNTPPSCPIFLQKQKRSPELATASKRAFIHNTISANEGIPLPRILAILPYLFRWFRVPYGITDRYDPHTTRAGLLITRSYHAGDTTPQPESHLCAVLRCDSRWYYYTNTNGLFSVPDTLLSIINEIWIIINKNRLWFVRHADDRVISVWIANHEVRTPKAISLVADSDGNPHPGAIIHKIKKVIYISKVPIADRLSPTEEDEILGKVAMIIGEDEENPSFKNVRKAFRSVARTYGKPSTRRHKRVLNIGRTILSRMHPDTHTQRRRIDAKPKSHTRKRHRGGYIPTPRNLHYLRLWKKHKSIGFTMRSSLKAKGLIPRANGTYRVSDKYKTRANRAKTHKKQSRKE
jgi:hypothetical protein